VTAIVPARLTVVTLGVRDLARMRDFYKGLGWKVAFEVDDDVTAFELLGAVLCLFPIDMLAADGRVTAATFGEGMRGLSLAINVDERDEVDEAIDAARAAGAEITKEPVDAEWGGRTAYFRDPEENYWEVAWVPPDSNMAAAIARATGRER
jgi:catechol 2,3-dioxygenase-like lactoylglutathione lyase family enzyme